MPNLQHAFLFHVLARVAQGWANEMVLQMEYHVQMPYTLFECLTKVLASNKRSQYISIA